MPSFKDLVWESTFRGVQFVILSCRVRSGRRLERHEVASREYAVWEDQGREPWKLDVQGLVVGDDYLDVKRALQKAVEVKGPGDLYTPYTGLVPVRCTGIDFGEQIDERRMARFSAAFEEERDDAFDRPTSASAASEALGAATELEETSAAELEAALDTAGPELVRQGPAAVIRATANKIRALNPFHGAAAEIAALTQSLDLLVTSATELVTAPADLASQILFAVKGLGAYQAAPKGALFAYQALFENEVPGVSGGGSTALQAASNAAAVTALVQDAALAGWAGAAVVEPWETLEEALAARDALLAAIEARADAADSNAIVVALGALRAQVVAALPPPDRDLPRLKTLELAGTTNGLALSYELYGATEAAEELARRNGVRNPLFFTGAVQALSEV